MDAFGFRLAIEFRVQIGAPLGLGLVFFHRNPMGVGPGVLPNARHLPGDFTARLATRNLEAVAGDFLGDVQVRSGRADGGKLVAKVAVQRLEPPWQLHPGLAVGVEGDVAIVDVHHVRAFDEGVGKILIGWIQRMVDLELATGFAQVAVNGNLAIKIPRTAAP